MFDATKSFDKLKEFFFTHCTKKNNMQVFYSLFRWSTKKDEAFLTVNYLKKIREQQMNETRKQRERQKDIEGIVKNMKRSYSIKKKEKKLIQQNN